MKLLRLVVLPLLLAVPLAYADSAATRPAPATERASTSLKYLAADSLNVLTLLPAPPADDSPECRAECDEMVKIQALASTKELARAKSESHLTPFLFADVLGQGFTAQALPTTAKLLKRVATDADAFCNVGKKYWNRRRPFVTDPRITVQVDRPGNASYPSGHTTLAYCWALVLADLFPEHTDALLARARLVARDRVIGGVHYPTDVAAGETLGRAVGTKIVASPVFQHECAAVRAELSAAGLLAIPAARVPATQRVGEPVLVH